jgi:flagellar basal-body rod modification protein FlgD
MGSATATVVAAHTRAADNERQAAQTTSANEEVSQEVFLRLLVAQIRNQNPLNPADSIEFLSQLAEFSSLEQMIAIRDEVAGLRETIEGAIDGDASAGSGEGEAEDS